jgi:hypothetical protein
MHPPLLFGAAPDPKTVLDDIPALAAAIRETQKQERTPDVDYARA